MAKPLREQAGTTPEQRTERRSKIAVPGRPLPLGREGQTGRNNAVPIAESILSLGDHVRKCRVCGKVKGGTQFGFRRGGGRLGICRVCEAGAKPYQATELLKLNETIRLLKGRLTRLEAKRTEIQGRAS